MLTEIIAGALAGFVGAGLHQWVVAWMRHRAQEDDAVDMVEFQEETEGSTRFKVVCSIPGRSGPVYEGNSAGDARRTIEALKANSQVEGWKAYRDGKLWDWGPREDGS